MAKCPKSKSNTMTQHSSGAAKHLLGMLLLVHVHVLRKVNRARKSRVYNAWCYEIHAIIGSLGTVRAQPRFRSHVKSMGDFRLLQLTVI